MQNDYLQTDVLLNGDGNRISVGTSQEGKIIFTPKINLYVISLGYQFVKTSIGRYTENEKVIQEVTFIRNKKLKKGKTYQFDFSIKGIKPATYNGENNQIKWFIKNTIKLDSKSFLRIRNHYLQKHRLTHFQDTPDLLAQKSEIHISNTHIPYNISNQKIHLEKSGLYPILLFLVGIIGGTYILSKLPLENNLYIWLGLVTILTLVFLVPHFYSSYILNKLNFEISTLEKNQFSANLSLKKNQNQIRKVEVKYSVHEEYRERSKIKNSTEEVVYLKTKATLYESTAIEKHRLPKNTSKILDFPEVTYDFIFDFPQEDISPTYTTEDLKIIWYLHITIYFIFGFKSSFKQKIQVDRNNLPQR